MLKNVASKIELYAYDSTTNKPKTGDAANITAYVSKGHAAPATLTDTSATEVDATKSPGIYQFDVTAGETNDDDLLFTGKSTTANIVVVHRYVTTRVDVGYVGGAVQTAVDIGYYFFSLIKRVNISQTGTDSTITLDAGAGLTSCERGDIIWLQANTGAGQSNVVRSYDNATKIATMTQNWNTAIGNPNNTTQFCIIRSDGLVPALLSEVTSHTDQIGFDSAGNVKAAAKVMADKLIIGSGTLADPFRGSTTVTG